MSGPGTTGGMYGAAGQAGGVGGPHVDREQLLQTVRSLHNFETVLEIARVRAIESGRPRVARVAGDLIAITEAEKKLVVRQSPFAASIGQAVIETIQQGVQQLQGAADDPDVQAALSEANPTLSALQSAVQTTGGFQQGGLQQWGQQQGTTQPQQGYGQGFQQWSQQPGVQSGAQQGGLQQPTPGPY